MSKMKMFVESFRRNAAISDARCDSGLKIPDDIDVINNATDKFSHCFIATAEDDFLKESCYKFYDRLKELGTNVSFKEYSSEENKLGHCFRVDMKSRYADLCNDEQCDFMKAIFCH